jgi:hypothetical protein
MKLYVVLISFHSLRTTTETHSSKKFAKGKRERKILPFVRISFGLDAVLQKSRLLQKAIKG